MRSKLWLLLIALAVGGIGFAAGSMVNAGPGQTGSQEIRLGTGKLTNPLLECEVAHGIIDARRKSFYSELAGFVSTIEQNPAINKISVYFRDLNNGPAFGVNESDVFTPASLLKVPVMMTYFKRAEADPSILSRRILFTDENKKSLNMDQQIAPAETLVAGKAYSVEELIEKMITYSDNNSTLLLLDAAPENALLEVYDLLNLDSALVSSESDTISVKQYSSFFRILFNASFLSQEYSEKALALLTGSVFADALRAGVPSDIVVAHKFGERSLDGLEQLHDCGIIYYPKHPYLLCMMSKGNDLNTLKNALKKISNFVYKQIDAQNLISRN